VRERRTEPDEPLFSVVIPAYNARRTIRETVESVLENEVPTEVVIVEDASADPVRASDLPAGPVRLISRETNGGTARARNRGIMNSRGRWIAFLDADDIYEPGRLDAASKFLESRQGLDGVITDALLVSPDGSSRIAAPNANSEGLLHLRTGCIFAAHILGRQIIEEIGLFDPRWERLEDVDYFTRLMVGGAKIGYVPRPAYVYRLNDVGKTQSGDWIGGLHELRDICLANALRPGVSRHARAVLLGRAFKREVDAVRRRFSELRGRTGAAWSR
jgi:teichuronic acid biosynthesis glycosyltransferase TuaG